MRICSSIQLDALCYAVSRLNDIVADHLHVLGDDALQLRQLADCITNVGIAKWRHLLCICAHAQVLAIVVGQLEQVQEGWLSILSAVEFEVELVDESECFTHEASLLLRDLLVLGGDGRNWHGGDEVGDLFVNSCHGLEVLLFVQFLEDMRLSHSLEEKLAHGGITLVELSEVDIHDVAQGIESTIEAEYLLISSSCTDILAIDLNYSRFRIENQSNIIQRILL